MIRSIVFACAIVACVFVSSPLHLPLNNPNEGVRVFAAKALVEHGTFAIDDVVREWGYIDDKSTYQGKLYSSKAPLASMVGALGYALVHPVTGDLERPALTRVCRATLAVFCLVPLWILWSGLRRRLRDPVVADLVVVGVLFATLPHFNVLSGHALAALAPAAAFVLICDGSRRALIIAGALLAAAGGAEYPALLACAPIALLAGRRVGWVALGGAPVVAMVMGAHTAMFGAPWRTGYGVLENAAYQKVVEGTLFGIGAPHVEVLGLVTFSPAVGLFWFAPFLLAGVAWIVVMIRDPSSRVQGIALSVALLGMLAFIAGFRGWRGGWSVGPRYISELIGVLAVPAALAFDRFGSARITVARALLAALVGITLVHSAIAGAFFPHLPDLFVNPVYEMMLPLVRLGMSPDSVPLAAGLPPALAAAIIVLVLAVPVLMQGRAALAAAVVAGVLFMIPVSTSGRSALEARRMIDNWRPEHGNPLMHDAAGRDDPRRLVAIGRVRDVLARSCVCLGPLVVVPDTLALGLAHVVDEPLLMMLASDIKGAPPCEGPIAVVGAIPHALTKLPIVHRDETITWLARQPVR